MTPQDWSATAAMTVALAGIVAIAAWALRGGGLRQVQSCRFDCPLLGRSVACRIEQDVRIGRWLRVQSCSAFDDPDEVSCGEACRTTMNLGLLVPAQRRG